jgi:5-methylcytosine-specific restriction endonuclease McrA
VTRETEPGFPKLREPRVRRARWLGLRRKSVKRAREERVLATEIRPALMLRSAGRCEARFDNQCWGVGKEIHHRLPRAAGGEHSVENTLLACPHCHSQIHAYPQVARARRLLVVPRPIGAWR